MDEMAKHMPGPWNTLPMMGGVGPFGSVEMGGMFTIVKVRDKLASYDEDPGFYCPQGPCQQGRLTADAHSLSRARSLAGDGHGEVSRRGNALARISARPRFLILARALLMVPDDRLRPSGGRSRRLR